MQKKCANSECGNEFEDRNTNNPQKYCSRECQDRVYYLKYRNKKILAAKAYVQKNKKRTMEYQKDYRKKHATDRKAYDAERVKLKSRLKQTYGITIEDWEGMFSSQEGRCAICGKHQSEVGKVFSVDHDHETGKVRGLLCHLCNMGLGSFQDDAELLENAMAYLDKYKGE